jgi:hypothetical protein
MGPNYPCTLVVYSTNGRLYHMLTGKISKEVKEIKTGFRKGQKLFIRRFYMKKMYCIIAVLGLFMFFTAPLAFGQDLGGAWFQVKFAGKGYVSNDLDASVGAKTQGNFVNYVQFVYNDLWAFPFYEMHVWYPTAMGWTYYFDTGADDMLLYGAPDWNLTFLDKQFATYGGYGTQWWYFADGEYFGWGSANVIIDVKRKNGAVNSATLQSLGCSGEGWTNNKDTYSYGGCTIKGKLVKAEKLPNGLDPAGNGPLYTPPGP